MDTKEGTGPRKKVRADLRSAKDLENLENVLKRTEAKERGTVFDKTRGPGGKKRILGETLFHDPPRGQSFTPHADIRGTVWGSAASPKGKQLVALWAKRTTGEEAETGQLGEGKTNKQTSLRRTNVNLSDGHIHSRET